VLWEAPPAGAFSSFIREAVSTALVRKRAARPVSVHDAMNAWFAGNFELCLELCDAVRHRDAATRTHVALLRARAMLRLDRPDDALRSLHDAAAIPAGTDEAITTRMLTGAARVRRGDVEDGLAVLVATASDARTAHPTIRSEIALNIGLARYAKGEFDAADRVLTTVTRDADLVYARAVQYRAWIAAARGHNDRATTLFAAALEQLDECRHYDAFFEANCTRALAQLALERLDRDIWPIIAARRARIDWSANGLAEPRFWAAYCAAGYQLDVAGDPLGAAREARHAESIAVGNAQRVQARCKRAAVARYTGEGNAYRDHAESAAELFATLGTETLTGDEKIVPLVLAEELASIDAVRAGALFELYARAQPMLPVKLTSHSPATAAYRSLVEAAIVENADATGAIQRYRRAFDIYGRIGFRRRAVMAALRIAAMTGDRKMLAYADRTTADLPAQSWLRREVEAIKLQRVQLTDVQREVAALICQGKSNPEIARLRNRSLHTVRNLVARLFEIFEVKSREELAVECVRRGIYNRA
jgi:DNA-binding CsgD family transcriptional regulator